MHDFVSDRRGSAVQWFALAAAAVCVACLAGAHGLDWLSQSGRVALVAYRAPAPTSRPASVGRAGSDPDLDMTPTGSVPAGSALVIRIR